MPLRIPTKIKKQCPELLTPQPRTLEKSDWYEHQSMAFLALANTGPDEEASDLIGQAQVHATLAVAASIQEANS